MHLISTVGRPDWLAHCLLILFTLSTVCIMLISDANPIYKVLIDAFTCNVTCLTNRNQNIPLTEVSTDALDFMSSSFWTALNQTDMKISIDYIKKKWPSLVICITKHKIQNRYVEVLKRISLICTPCRLYYSQQGW